MKLKPEQRLAADVAEARAIEYLRAQGRPCLAAQVADAIWPDHSMKAQGAGAAASRILKRLVARKLVKWKFVAYVGSGYVLTTAK